MTSVLSYNFIKKLQALPFVEAIFLFGSRAQDRNLTSHTYQEELALEIYRRIPAYLKVMRAVCDVLGGICQNLK